MSEVITKGDGSPFETERAAKAKQTIMLKEGVSTEVVEQEDGWVLKPIEGKTRRKRIPVGRQSVLTIDEDLKDPNFHYHIVNDKPGRISMYERAGYEHVNDSRIEFGDKRAARVSQKGASVTSTPVGGDTEGVLMRIPIEFYEEDQAAKQRKIDATEAEMRRHDLDNTNNRNPNAKGEYGQVKYE